MTDHELKHLAIQFGLKSSKIVPDRQLAGSPERTLARFVIQCDDNKTYVLEQVADQVFLTKFCIINVLDYLAKQECPYVHPYIKSTSGQALIKHDNSWWQLAPYIDGVELDRAQYYKEGWRGNILANFLMQLRQATPDMTDICSHSFFSLPDFITEFTDKLHENDPEIYQHITELLDHLQDFTLFYTELKAGFCHGDLHPLNVIWGKQEINAVIDWEFHGPKARMFDVANLVGCLGMEDPKALSSDLVLTLLATLRQQDYFTSLELDNFIDFMLATRFMWLSDWLRRKDKNMINLELTLMFLLFDNRNKLKVLWNL